MSNSEAEERLCLCHGHLAGGMRSILGRHPESSCSPPSLGVPNLAKLIWQILAVVEQPAKLLIAATRALV